MADPALIIVLMAAFLLVFAALMWYILIGAWRE